MKALLIIPVQACPKPSEQPKNSKTNQNKQTILDLDAQIIVCCRDLPQSITKGVGRGGSHVSQM